ncbi:MAG TPA: hypothetical protein VF444_23910 [Pseudonocardiaceae bacterium]
MRERAFRFFAQLTLPGTRAGPVIVRGGPMYFCLTDPASQAWTRVDATNTVTQGGTRRLWDELETAHDLFERLGQPNPQDFTITITPDGHQIVNLPRTARSWHLPL